MKLRHSWDEAWTELKWSQDGAKMEQRLNWDELGTALERSWEKLGRTWNDLGTAAGTESIGPSWSGVSNNDSVPFFKY